MTLITFLLVLSFVLFLLAGVSVPSGRFNLGWLGAAIVTFVVILGAPGIHG